MKSEIKSEKQSAPPNESKNRRLEMKHCNSLWVTSI